MTAYLATAAVALIAVASGLWTAYTHGEEAGRVRVQQLWDQDSARRAVRIAESQVRARAAEQALVTAAATKLKAKNDELDRTRRVLGAELERLRNRPEVRAPDRPGGPADIATTGVGCTGAGLARPDAVFLAGYAADARRLQLEFDRCQAAYDGAVESLRAIGEAK